ncbi:helix-turn-helix domain-containing protein [Mesorhizobium sp. M1E.F.Ca.ET.063.01.1.1]|uniref:helix-turn-helix domain-containing protein n=1 Tax=Mesorhizobium sp. M1E.F.Ca.ET.063.01.1.1 TaxID=2496750 RepID=UPI000FCC20C2|nr:helix-turn-helix domain-containing protein [Mesorhizobium sp. M1E.F.Ca.ET.063.01.1.1]RUW85916.1 XRE family transcriptional regulator [Mesorhizobium sp. M1E.F.Ca.ET.063.01.1.1]
MDEREKLALEVKAWRAEAGFTAEAAAKLLGIPKRTFEGIEQGRGFPYALLLRVAMDTNALSLKAMQEKSSLKD